jgi:hypothetical protein
MNLRSGRNKDAQIVVKEPTRVSNMKMNNMTNVDEINKPFMRSARARVIVEKLKKLKILVMPLRTIILLAVFVFMIGLSIISKLCDRLSSFLMYKIFIYYGGMSVINYISATKQWTRSKIDSIYQFGADVRNIFRLPEIPVVRFRNPITVERKIKEV